MHGFYDAIANLLYKDLMAEKYKSEEEFYEKLNIKRSEKTRIISNKLREEYLGKLKLKQYSGKLKKQDKIDIAMDAYGAVEHYFRVEYGLPDNTIIL